MSTKELLIDIWIKRIWTDN